MNKELQLILDCVPKDSCEINWEALESSCLGVYFAQMAEKPQNPFFHGEGDVYTHTKMVCRELVKLDEYKEMSDKDKEIMFLACLLHDVGKIKCTKLIDGRWSSPYHSKKGALKARSILWKELGLCGSYELQQMRECICYLIRYHSFPPYAMESERGEIRILKIASQGELCPLFTMRKLYILEKADMLGRICPDIDRSLEKVEYFKIMCQELSCLDSPYKFADEFSQRAYFKERLSYYGQSLFDDSWGEVIILSGLPGTGKDTWIKKNYPDTPVVSLDDIRLRLNVSPTDKQAPVIEEAERMSRELLRQKQPFIWNATSINSQLRQGQIALFEDYGARVKIVFLETEWSEQLRRNSDRRAVVPQPVIEKMLNNLEIPERHECQRVIWQIT
ncbi:MAG: AAA family ATPase [Clostridia bacterium]|nr:AAA family ATPase [Clostridia bacterium]